MNRCDQARRLFDAYWDDEVTQAEREWLESHFTGCPGCRQAYEQLARTLETVGSLPRVEVSRDLPERALLAARRAQAAPDRVASSSATPRWVPVTAAAALVFVAAALLLPVIRPGAGVPGLQASRTGPEAPIVQPRLVASADPTRCSTTPRTWSSSSIPSCFTAAAPRRSRACPPARRRSRR